MTAPSAGGTTARLHSPGATSTSPIGVVIAAFDEARALRTLLPRVAHALEGSPLRVIVSSDGSTDGTPQVARRLGAMVIDSAVNRGKSAALRDGIARAMADGCDPIALLDGDGQHDPDDLPDLIGPLVEGHADLVIGSRYLDDPGRGATPFNRYLVRSATCWLLRRLVGRDFTDPYCGYRAMRREAAPSLAITGSRYQCEVDMLFAAQRAGLRIVEVPVTRLYGPGMTTMGARHGRFLGRLMVLTQYGRALIRGAVRRRG